METMLSSSLVELKTQLDKKSISSVEATRACLDALEKLKGLNAFIEVCGDQAIVQAELADKKIAAGQSLPLLGVPVALKDIILSEGTHTTAGSKILSNFASPYDATVTRKLKEAGAVIVGKTNLDEFAMGSSNENSFFGPVKNPWNTEYVPGGSSGGSAAAVAARMVPTALGTDTGGSIRQPASLCGIVGLKPTYGRVSRYGVVAYASSLDQVGCFTRTVRDCALVTQILSGKDPRDSTSVDTPVPNLLGEVNQSIKGLKIGIPKEYFIDGVSKEVQAAIRTAIASLEKQGAIMVDISLPHTDLAVSVYYILAPAEASSNLARYDGIRYGHRTSDHKDLKDLYFRSRSEGFGAEVKRRIMVGTYVLSTGYFDAYYLRAQKVRTLIAQDFKSAFATHCDVIACPTAPTTAFKIGEKVDDPVSMYLNDIFTIPVNLAGLPGISIPCGFDTNGLPIGLQLIGKPFDEASLIRVASAYESTSSWHRKLPPVHAES